MPNSHPPQFTTKKKKKSEWKELCGSNDLSNKNCNLDFLDWRHYKCSCRCLELQRTKESSGKALVTYSALIHDGWGSFSMRTWAVPQWIWAETVQSWNEASLWIFAPNKVTHFPRNGHDPKAINPIICHFQGHPLGVWGNWPTRHHPSLLDR